MFKPVGKIEKVFDAAETEAPALPTCSHCGALLRAEDRFCDQCGRPPDGGGCSPAPGAPARKGCRHVAGRSPAVGDARPFPRGGAGEVGSPGWDAHSRGEGITPLFFSIEHSGKFAGMLHGTFSRGIPAAGAQTNPRCVVFPMRPARIAPFETDVKISSKWTSFKKGLRT